MSLQFLKNNIKPPVIFITFLNIGFFMCVQIIFFYIIASKQIDVIIESKADIINNYVNHSQDTNDILKNYMSSPFFKEKQQHAISQEKLRLELNRKIIWIKLKNFLIVIFTIVGISLVGSLIFKFKYWRDLFHIDSNTEDDWTISLSDQILILFVLGAFSTELLFFFGLVDTYEFVGDYESVNGVFKSMIEYYNKLQ
jgi:hypothetical protein